MEKYDKIVIDQNVNFNEMVNTMSLEKTVDLLHHTHNIKDMVFSNGKTISEIESNADMLLSNIDDITNTIDRINKSLEDSNSKIDLLQSETDEFKNNDINSLRELIKSASDLIKENNKNLYEYLVSINDYKNKIQDYLNKLDKFDSVNVDDVKSIIERLYSRIDYINALLNSVKDETTLINNLNTKVENLSLKISETSELLNNADEKYYTDIINTINSIKDTISKTASKIDEINSYDDSKLVKTINRQTARIDSMRKSIEKLAVSIDNDTKKFVHNGVLTDVVAEVKSPRLKISKDGDSTILTAVSKDLEEKSVVIKPVPEYEHVASDMSNFIAKDNKEYYHPKSNYHPATKKYTDGIFNSLSSDESFLTENGINGLRYFNDKLEYLNPVSKVWEQIVVSGTDNLTFIPDDLILFHGEYNPDSKTCSILLSGPEDTIIDEQTVCSVESIKLVKKINSCPDTEDDGETILVLNRDEFNKYSNECFIDTITEEDVNQVFYKAFIKSSSGITNDSDNNVLIIDIA